MTVTAPNLIRWSGLAAIAAGLIFAGIQPIHPADVLASVTTSFWAVIISLKFAMCLFFLIGVTGIYARQAEHAGWLGFVGFALLVVSFWLQTGFVFVELFVLPVIATSLPGFVDSALGIANGQPGVMNIGAFVPAYGVLGICYSWVECCSALPRCGPACCPAGRRFCLPLRQSSPRPPRSCRTHSSATRRSLWALP